MDIFKNTQKQLRKIAEIIKLDRNILEQLLEPQRILKVNIPVKMDSGEMRIFIGFRSQYNDARGPYKGGIRFHQGVTEEEVKSLSAWMTWKTAVVNIPLGGGKGGIIVNPKELSDRELEALSRGYVKAIWKFIGPDIDVPAPDVNTDPRIMGWMLDEYEKMVGHHAPGVITGKPLSIGGSAGRAYSTAQGGFYVLEYALKKIGLPSGATVAIQGFGNAGYNIAKIMEKSGFKIVSVSDSHGTATDCKNGLSVEMLMKYKKETGSVANYPGADGTNKLTCFEQDADILVPAALEGTIHKDNADVIKARIILELANGPVTSEADEIFDKKGVMVIPDILANAGGVGVSYFEQIQNATSLYWSEGEVLKRLEKMMHTAFEDVWMKKEQYKTNLRTAANILAVERVAQAMKDRGRV
ncbi:MAG TPA: Glu/Leu/Phe/Val dehydrogenase [Patescibacteria group bacterium]|nr:Glu/Leu/Phe/Val dehydrogenase [Patescibacteria group bacterium]